MPREADKPAAVAAFTLRVDEAELLAGFRVLDLAQRERLLGAVRAATAERLGRARVSGAPAERAAARGRVDRPTGGPA